MINGYLALQGNTRFRTAGKRKTRDPLVKYPFGPRGKASGQVLKVGTPL